MNRKKNETAAAAVAVAVAEAEMPVADAPAQSDAAPAAEAAPAVSENEQTNAAEPQARVIRTTRRRRNRAAKPDVENTGDEAEPGVIRVVPEGYTGKHQRQSNEGPITREELQKAIQQKTIFSVPVTHITDDEIFVLLKSDDVSGHLFGVMNHSDFDEKEYAGYEGFVGEMVDVVITGFDPARGMAVVSRRAARTMKRQQLLESGFGLGSVVVGVVRSIRDYAAFVDVGGLHCILPVNEISYGFVNHPGDVLNRGDEVMVKVIDWHPESLKCRVSIKALQDPWAKVNSLYDKGMVVSGSITGVRDRHVWVRPTPYHGVEILCPAVGERRYDTGREVRVRLTTVAPDQQKLRGKIIAFVR